MYNGHVNLHVTGHKSIRKQIFAKCVSILVINYLALAPLHVGMFETESLVESQSPTNLYPVTAADTEPIVIPHPLQKKTQHIWYF